VNGVGGYGIGERLLEGVLLWVVWGAFFGDEGLLVFSSKFFLFVIYRWVE